MKVVVLLFFFYEPFTENVTDYQLFTMKPGYTIEQCYEVAQAEVPNIKNKVKNGTFGYLCKEVDLIVLGDPI